MTDLYHFIEIDRTRPSVWGSGRFRQLSAPTPSDGSALVKDHAPLPELDDVSVEPEDFLQKIALKKVAPYRLDKLSKKLPEQSPVTLAELTPLFDQCRESGTCVESLLCQPLRMLEVGSVFEISADMFQSSVLESGGHSLVYTFRFCLSLAEVAFLHRLAPLLQEEGMSVFVYDVSLNELESLDIGREYGPQNGMIFLKGNVKPLVVKLRFSVSKLRSEDAHRLLGESLVKMVKKTLGKHIKTEDI